MDYDSDVPTMHLNTDHYKIDYLIIKKRFPTKIPVVFRRAKSEKILPHLSRCNYVVPQSYTVSQMVNVIRDRLQVSSSISVFFLVRNKYMVSMSKTMYEVYNEFQEEDGSLQITYASQETFG